MPRHSSSQPTEVELEILHTLWELGPCPLGNIHQAVAERREVAYSTTRKMIQVMREKGLVQCDETVRPQLYRAARSRKRLNQGC
jgi:BlaI family penicillinase repressor